MFVHAFIGLLLVWMCCIQVHIIHQYILLSQAVVESGLRQS